MNGILAMKLRYMGYWIMMDSWFSGLTLFLHGRYWGVNMAGTFRENRKGLDSKKSSMFADLKKELRKKWNPKKKTGYIRGAWEPRSARNHDLVVSVVKDSKVFMEGTNAIGSHEAGFFTRWSRDERKYVQLRGWKVHPFFGKHYKSGDQGAMSRNEGNGHKYRTNK